MTDQKEPSTNLVRRGVAYLDHHGVKGMKWGVRKTEKGSQLPSSEDHIRTTQIRENIKSHGTRVVSNAELNDVLNRMNLEQRYSDLSSKKSTINTGHVAVKNILSLAKTAAEIHSLMRSPLYSTIKKTISK